MSVEPSRQSFESAELIPFPTPWRGPRPLATMVPDHGPVLRRWVRRWRHRRAIEDLAVNQPDSVLRDIGVTRIDALREARKPFWMA